MRTEDIVGAEALPTDANALIAMIRELAQEIVALREEVSSLRRAVLMSPHPDHR